MPSYSSIKPSTTFGTDAGKTYIQAGIDSATITNLIPTTSSVSSSADLSPTGNSIGDQALVGSNLYIWNGSGWYSIALINTSPTWDSGGQPEGSYVLDADSPQTATTITLAASDPEGITISYNYITGGSMDSIATISQDSSVFTITPKTEAQAPDGGTGSITFRATDGVNILPQVSSFTLNFISIVTNSRYTSLLATATGTSDNNNITDASTNTHSMTVNGDAYAGTFSPYRSRGYSTYFEDTAANVLYASPSSDFAFGTGAFTISVWVKLLHQWRGTIFDTNDGSNPGVMMAVNNTYFYIYSNTFLSSTTTSSQDVWQHFCWTRDGSGNNKVFINGTQATTFTDSTDYTSQNFKMGEEQNGNNDLKAYVKDLHIVKGYAYEPDSTYADGAAEPTTGTVFLGCSLPYHGDKSSSSKTLTVANSGISIVSDTPHEYNEYLATDHGGSIYFAGSSAETPGHSSLVLDTSDFTVEFWYKHVANVATMRFLGNNYQNSTWGGGRWTMGIVSGKLIFQVNSMHGGGNMTASTVNIDDGSWHHCSLTRNGSTFTLRVDGSNSVTYNNSGSIDGGNSYGFTVGGRGNGSESINGYISDFRIVKGTVVYSGNFTPPTAPLSSSGASLHIKGTDASIIDKSQGSNLKLIADTVGSTTQVKFANTKSMYFDGAGDYITIGNSEAYGFGTGSWTFEVWLYCTRTGASNAIFDTRVGTGTETGSFGIGMLSNGQVQMFSGGVLYKPAETLSFNVWQHLAIVKNASTNTTTMYFNGTAAATTYSDTRDYGSSQPVQIAKDDWVNYFGGYMQDLRVTKGLARYTANFTPPTISLEG